MSVIGFRRCSANRNERYIRVFRAGSDSRIRIFKFFRTTVVHIPRTDRIARSKSFPFFFHPSGIKGIHFRIQLKTEILESTFQVHDVRFVYIAGTFSTGYEVIRTHAEKCNLHRLGNRQRAVVLEKHHAFRSSIAPYSRVCLKIRIISVFISVETWSFHHKLENTFHACVYFRLFQRTVLERSDNRVIMITLAGLNHVISDLHLLHGIQSAAPVSHHGTPESPLISENLSQKFITLGSIFAVHIIIRSHHCPRITFLHGDFEAFQIDFPQRTFAQAGVIGQTVDFLIIYSIMLYTGSDALALHTANIGRSYLTC